MIKKGSKQSIPPVWSIYSISALPSFLTVCVVSYESYNVTNGDVDRQKVNRVGHVVSGTSETQ